MRLVNQTFLEVEGWRRIKFFPSALKQFGFDPDSANLIFEEVRLPISISNHEFCASFGHTYLPCEKTFLV